MNTVILQSNIVQFPSQNSGSVVIGLIVLAGIIVLITLAGMSISKGSSSGYFGRFSFRAKCRAYGLDKPQILLLEHLATTFRIIKPEHILDNTTLLDSFMRKAIHSTDTSTSITDQEKESRKAILFQIRQIIDRENEKRNIITSSTHLKLNQEIEIITQDRIHAESQINKNHTGYLAVDLPVTNTGREIRPAKGTDLKVLFSRNGRDLYSFESRVIGYTQNRNILSMLLKHSDKLKQEQKRKFRRKEISVPSYFYPILVIETGTGKHKEKQAMIDTKRRYLGTILDISAGGCSIKTATALSRGQLLKIEFNTGRDKTVAVLGKVIQVRREQGRGTVMHIMFTRVSQRTINIIQEYVFGIS